MTSDNPPNLIELFTGVRRIADEAISRAGAEGSIQWKDRSHPTGLGAECVRVGGKLYNANFLNNFGLLREPDYLGLCHLLVAMARRVGDPLFRLRFGGYRKAICECDDSSYAWFHCKSQAEFHSCDRTAYRGSSYAIPGGPVILSGWPVDRNGGSKKKTLPPLKLLMLRCASVP